MKLDWVNGVVGMLADFHTGMGGRIKKGAGADQSSGGTDGASAGTTLSIYTAARLTYLKGSVKMVKTRIKKGT